jgi:division protein CdvB (Snf7/Vps24/ESCRT-III family)
MGYITKNWNGVKNSINLSQKFLNKIKPETALKNRISDAEKKLEYQISRLDQVHNKLKQNHDHLFKKIVEAKLIHNESRARTYAIELQEIKKIKNKIAGAKLAMEQIKLRLGTVSELGDIVVTLSPCMSLIKGLTPSISGLFPQINTTMQDLPNMFEDILAGSSLSAESMMQPYEGSADTEAILNEAQHALEGKTRTSIPEAPVTAIENLSKKKKTMI